MNSSGREVLHGAGAKKNAVSKTEEADRPYKEKAVASRSLNRSIVGEGDKLQNVIPVFVVRT